MGFFDYIDTLIDRSLGLSSHNNQPPPQITTYRCDRCRKLLTQKERSVLAATRAICNACYHKSKNK